MGVISPRMTSILQWLFSAGGRGPDPAQHCHILDLRHKLLMGRTLIISSSAIISSSNILPVGFLWAWAWFQWGILPEGWGYVKASCLSFVQILCAEDKVGELWGFTLNPMQTLGAIWQMSWTIIYHTRKYALEYLWNAKQKQIYLSQQIKHSPLVYNPKPQSQAI